MENLRAGRAVRMLLVALVYHYVELDEIRSVVLWPYTNKKRGMRKASSWHLMIEWMVRKESGEYYR